MGFKERYAPRSGPNKIDIKNLYNELPPNLKKAFKNFINNEGEKTALYFYRDPNLKLVYNINDYIPLGYSDHGYLVFHKPSKKLLFLEIGKKYTKNQPGEMAKNGNDLEDFARHMKIFFTKPENFHDHYSKNDLQKFEKDVSREIGIPVSIYYADHLASSNRSKYIQLHPKKLQDELDYAGSKEINEKLKSFEKKLLRKKS